jgi:hypothetical protein
MVCNFAFISRAVRTFIPLRSCFTIASTVSAARSSNWTWRAKVGFGKSCGHISIRSPIFSTVLGIL